MLAEENKTPDDKMSVSSIIDQMIVDEDREGIPEHLRLLARQLELALARQKAGPKLDD